MDLPIRFPAALAGSSRILPALAGLLWFMGAAPPAQRSFPVAQANDNRHPAGRIRDDTLRVSLVVRMATWFPEADDGPSVTVAAFAEGKKQPQIPAPLLRVPAGTVIDATVRNDLADSTITVRGLATRPAVGPDALVIAPGTSARVRFPAGAPGTYLYWADIGVPETGKVEREQVAGALVVDPPGTRADDRIFVINIWGEAVGPVRYRNALAVNGRSFPYGERIEPAVGDSLRWRWINASRRNHPMHLHGFYFRVLAKGDGRADTAYTPTARRLVVTENLTPRQTMSLVWSPDRPGNWLFHCHLMFHVLDDARLGPGRPPTHAHPDVGGHMAGLALLIAVRPLPDWHEPSRPDPQTIRLLVQEGRPHGRARRAMGYVRQRGTTAPAPDSVEIPGGVLVLTRGRPTDVTVVNALAEPTAVHWHGIELESYSDGVAGWSGAGARVAPAIQPGDSFTAHLTLPRAGTFIYHTHLSDLEQLTSGLYGALVVLEPGRGFDPATDHVYVAGWDGAEDPPQILINGDSLPAPLEIAAGVTHRFRFVNIGMAVRLRFTITADSRLLTWRRVAKDGADLPPEQARAGPADLTLAVGETADAELTPPGPGALRLDVFQPNGRRIWSQQLVAR